MTTAPPQMFWSGAGTSPLHLLRPRFSVATLFAELGTSAGVAHSVDLVPAASHRPAEQTSPGIPPSPAVEPGAALGELRRLTGLSWDQLASLFGVSRRALHFWANGKAMTREHHVRLRTVLELARTVDRGSARETHDALLAAGPDGVTPFQSLQNGDVETALARLGPGRGRVAARSRASSVLSDRRPLSPATLADALQDRAGIELPAGRRVKARRR